jgi:shikimate dehydrogenase
MSDKYKEEFAIFGNPIKHSISPKLHNTAFKLYDINANYIKYKLEDKNILKKIFLEKNFKGANITIPFKEDAYKQADKIKGIANKIGSVNTYIKDKDKIVGYNTDAPGFMKSIEEFKDIKKVLIIGAGGTARAISIALIEEKKDVTVLNRSANKLIFFRNIGCKVFDWDNFLLDSFDLVVNTTSAGLEDDTYPVDKNILENIFLNSKYAFDCIYSKETPFINLAKKENLKVKDGLDMLLYQGILAFELFTNQKVSDEVIQKIKKEIESN